MTPLLRADHSGSRSFAVITPLPIRGLQTSQSATLGLGHGQTLTDTAAAGKLCRQLCHTEHFARSREVGYESAELQFDREDTPCSHP